MTNSSDATDIELKIQKSIDTFNEIFSKLDWKTQKELILFDAVNNGRIDMVKMLLKRGENPNQIFNSISPVFISCELHHNEIVKLLLKYGANTKCKNINLLCTATANENVELVKYLIENKHYDNINDVSFDGKDTALHLAVSIENTELVDLLLEQKDIDINVTNQQGETPLYVACGVSNRAIANRLLSRSVSPRADPNILVKNCVSPLARCIYNCKIRMVELLVEYGAKITENELYVASGNPKNFNIMKFLLANR
jgi:ankyrin repeat protein